MSAYQQRLLLPCAIAMLALAVLVGAAVGSYRVFPSPYGFVVVNVITSNVQVCGAPRGPYSSQSSEPIECTPARLAPDGQASREAQALAAQAARVAAYQANPCTSGSFARAKAAAVEREAARVAAFKASLERLPSRYNDPGSELHVEFPSGDDCHRP